MGKRQLKDDKNQRRDGGREHDLWNRCPKKIRGHGIKKHSSEKKSDTDSKEKRRHSVM